MRRFAPSLVLVTALLLASCSSSDSGSADRSDPTSATTTTASQAADGTGGKANAGGTGHPCDQGASMDQLKVEPVRDIESDRTLTSFDGTEIRLHWFPIASATSKRAPTILMGPGWSLAGDTSTNGAALFGALSISSMRTAGYNVLTWDPRGFGQSDGKASVNDPKREGRDVQALIDFVAEQPQAQLDGDGDPRMGMVGFSYGGGIQLTTAAIDCRVDAIVPGIAWHSLETSLYKADTVKSGWSKILTSTVPKDRLDPHIVSATASGLGDGTLSKEDHDWFLSRGPGDLVAKIDVPTLLIQGTVDTLFTLDEGITNYEILKKAKVPVHLLFFCGGHGTCLTKSGDPSRVTKASFAWLDHYLKGKDTDLGATIDLIDQDGTRWVADDWPAPTGSSTGGEEADQDALVGISKGGALELTDASRSGGITPAEGSTDPMAGLVSGITPTKADHAFEVPLTASSDDLLLGAPRLVLRYSGTSPAGDQPTRAFAQVVDESSGLVIGNQITPLALVLDGKDHELDVDLEVIAQHVVKGQKLTLQIVATTSAYATPRLGGHLDIAHAAIALPIADPKLVTKG